MHGHINVKSPNNISKWQMGFNSAFKGLIYIVNIVGYFLSCITMHGFMNVKLPNCNGPSAARTSSKPAFHLHDLCKFSFSPTKDTVFSNNDNPFIFLFFFAKDFCVFESCIGDRHTECGQNVVFNAEAGDIVGRGRSNRSQGGCSFHRVCLSVDVRQLEKRSTDF
jgi:hypothetical protein